jgi:RNA polymerase sigma-70 factor, ECF subfamily
VAPADGSVIDRHPPASEKISRIEGMGRHRSARREEDAWVRAAQAGNIEGVERLFKRHWRPAYRAAYLVVHDAAAAEDIAQESFLAAIRALGRFDRQRPFGPWLHRIVVNRAIDWSRARALRREVSERPDEADRSPSSASSDDLVSVLGLLPPEQRGIVVMRYLFEYTPGEIAKMLELPRGTVNSRLRRGLDALAEHLDEGSR